MSRTTAIAHALEVRGVKSEVLFEKADIPYPWAANASERVETRKVSTLVRLAVDATGDPCFGLKLVPYLHAANFQALGYSLFSSSTLNEFCLRLVRFFRLVSQSSRHYLEEREDGFKLTFEITNPEVCDETVDAWIGTLVHFCRCIYRPDFSPRRVDFLRPEPGENSAEFARFFNAPINFSARENAIYFAKSDMLVPLPSANKELARRNDEVIIEHLARLDRDDVVRQVEACIIELLPTGDCSRDAIAARLNMSPQHAQQTGAAQYQLQGGAGGSAFDPGAAIYGATEYAHHRNHLPAGILRYQQFFPRLSPLDREVTFQLPGRDCPAWRQGLSVSGAALTPTGSRCRGRRRTWPGPYVQSRSDRPRRRTPV